MSLIVRSLQESDLAAAERINRLAFGTFFGHPDPPAFRGDGDVTHGRFRTDPDGAFGVELDGCLVASGHCMNWGSVGILGPLTVDVDVWNKGVARELLPVLTDLLDSRGHAFSGLFTHPQSPKHIRLYEQFGFWMQRPTGIMEKPVTAGRLLPDGVSLFSEAGEGAAAVLLACREVSETVYPGLDLTREIRAVADQGLGETILISRDGAVVGFAVCHHGAMSEAGSPQLVVKFGAVRTGPDAAGDFRALIAAAEAVASARGAARVVAGTNVGREGAYRALLEAGFRTFMNGIAMIRPDGPGYNLPGSFVIDDWR